MGADLRELDNLVTDLLREDAALIKPDEELRAIAMAVYRFSKDNPREVTDDISADGGYSYTLPDLWVDGFSRIISVEYPAGEQDPAFLEECDYGIYDDGSTKKLRFWNFSATSGYTIRLKFTTTWTVTTSATTIEDKDAVAVANLAASICLRQLANHYAQTSKPSLDVDVIDYSRKSVEVTMLADVLENVYRDYMGIPRIGARAKEGAAPISAASLSKDLDIEFPWKENYITHPKRWR